MKAVEGPISTRLRALFKPRASEWTPDRQPEAIRDMPEENYTGRTLGARYRRIGKHRGEA